MEFEPQKEVGMIPGKVIYKKKDLSFDFIPQKSADFSVVIEYLHLTFDTKTQLARQVWGYDPYHRWLQKNLTPPKSVQCGLKIITPIETGWDFRLIEAGEWPAYFDQRNGWVCIGDCNPSKSDLGVEFAKGIITVLHSKKLKAIWLKPTII